MLKILSLSLFLLYPLAQAYEPEDFNFNHVQYRQYVVPQVKALISNYKKILFFLSPKLEAESKIIDEFDNFISYKPSFIQKCKANIKSPECKEEAKKIFSALEKMKETQRISIKDPLEAFDKKLQLLFFKQEVIKDYKPNIYEFQKDIEELYFSYHLDLISTVPESIRTEVHGLWINFIYPLTFELKDESAESFFKENTTILNRAWNLFHVQISKRDLKVEQKDLNFVAIMHSRWNQILKVILKR